MQARGAAHRPSELGAADGRAAAAGADAGVGYVRRFGRATVKAETVEYVRRPGNHLVRRYEGTIMLFCEIIFCHSY